VPMISGLCQTRVLVGRSWACPPPYSVVKQVGQRLLPFIVPKYLVSKRSVYVSREIHALIIQSEIKTHRYIRQRRADHGLIRVIAKADHIISIHIHKSQIARLGTCLCYTPSFDFLLSLVNAICLVTEEVPNWITYLHSCGSTTAHTERSIFKKVNTCR